MWKDKQKPCIKIQTQNNQLLSFSLYNINLLLRRVPIFFYLLLNEVHRYFHMWLLLCKLLYKPAIYHDYMNYELWFYFVYNLCSSCYYFYMSMSGSIQLWNCAKKYLLSYFWHSGTTWLHLVSTQIKLISRFSSLYTAESNSISKFCTTFKSNLLYSLKPVCNVELLLFISFLFWTFYALISPFLLIAYLLQLD